MTFNDKNPSDSFPLKTEPAEVRGAEKTIHSVSHGYFIFLPKQMTQKNKQK